MKILHKGFTFIELLLVMSVVAILTSMVSLALVNSRSSTSLETVTATFMADFKNQQTKAMTGDTEGQGVPDHYGIHISPQAYTMFRGSSFAAQAESNFLVPMEDTIRITTTFSDDILHFATQSGEMSNFISGQNTITFSDSATTKQKILHVNKYGSIYDEE
jgi:prepilin-type N-terminal cleavage/methylation domain-containing protein